MAVPHEIPLQHQASPSLHNGGKPQRNSLATGHSGHCFSNWSSISISWKRWNRSKIVINWLISVLSCCGYYNAMYCICANTLNIYIYIHMCVCVTRVCVCVLHVCMCSCLAQTHDIYVYIYIYTYTRIYHICIFLHSYMHIYVYISTYVFIDRRYIFSWVFDMMIKKSVCQGLFKDISNKIQLPTTGWSTVKLSKNQNPLKWPISKPIIRTVGLPSREGWIFKRDPNFARHSETCT